MRRVAALAVLVLPLVLSAGATGRPADNFVYSPATLPAAVTGTQYDVTMTATYNGTPMCLDSGWTINTTSTVAPGVFIKKGKPAAGGCSIQLVGTPTKPGAYTFPLCVNVDGQCGPSTWTLTVTGAAATKPELTYAEAQKFVQHIQSAITLERKARDEILQNTYHSLGEAATALSASANDLYQVTQGLPRTTFFGPNPVPDLKRAYHTDFDVGDDLRGRMAGDGFGKPLPKAVATQLATQLGPALTQKKQGLTYMKQVASRLAP